MDNYKLQLLLNEISDAALAYLFPGFRKKDFHKPSYFHSSCIENWNSNTKNLNFCVQKKSENIQEIDDSMMCCSLLLEESTINKIENQETKTSIIRAEIQNLLKKYEISIQELEQLLSYEVKLSHLKITRNHNIILEDFGAKEVKMDKLSKSIFLLYLKHPNGIRFKELCDYRDELEDIYLSIVGRANLETKLESIEKLTNSTMSNSINEKVSKISRAFRQVVDERIAKYYYIDGKKGEVKSIALDRSLVLWE